MNTDIPPTIGLQEASRMLGISRTTAYAMIKEGRFPTPVKRFGQQYRVLTAPLLEYLDIDPFDPKFITRAPVLEKEPAILSDAKPAYVVRTTAGKEIVLKPEKTYRYKGKRVTGAYPIKKIQQR